MQIILHVVFGDRTQIGFSQVQQLLGTMLDLNTASLVSSLPLIRQLRQFFGLDNAVSRCFELGKQLDDIILAEIQYRRYPQQQYHWAKQERTEADILSLMLAVRDEANWRWQSSLFRDGIFLI